MRFSMRKSSCAPQCSNLKGFAETRYPTEIELGMKISTIESQASNSPMTKGITYVDIAVRPIKIVEYVGVDIGFQQNP